MGYGLVLWDFDGTLADTSKDVWVSLRYAAARCNSAFAASFEANGANLALPVSEIFLHLDPQPPFFLCECFERDVSDHYRRLNDFEHTNLYPGIEELIDSLRHLGVKQAVITNKPLPALKRILIKKKWARLFDGFSSTDEGNGVVHSKAELIQSFMDDWPCLRPVYVGDSWSDIAAAHECEIDCIGVTYGDGDVNKLRQQAPTFLADDIKQIESHLMGAKNDC
ncbi:HAD family hydrolase [uncultured Olegusella sp.]|uniref:HAD family hydrolase n=1 Tax=uncultured Olegusella sp. TaxID=1979846 RepID=UPI0026260472|nr:HAD family hydrolase [uncultured Olegusella sp.]